jgi:hypothetical protein
VERDEPKQSESVGQTLPQLPWKQKRGDLKNVWIPYGNAILNLITTPKASTHYGEYSYDIS